MKHTHDDERHLTFGCHACIQVVRRTQQIEEEDEWRKKPWLATDEWREQESDRLEARADGILDEAHCEADELRAQAEFIRSHESPRTHLPGQQSMGWA